MVRKSSSASAVTSWTKRSDVPEDISSRRPRPRPPADEHGEKPIDVDLPAEEQHDRRREKRVLDDLRGADQVLRRPLDRCPEAREHEQSEERCRDDPQPSARRSGSQPNRKPAATAQPTVIATAMSEL